MAAANESQGLKIAVAAFVTLTVILAVTSYFLYSAYSRTEAQLRIGDGESLTKAKQGQRATPSTSTTNSDEARRRPGRGVRAAKAEIDDPLQEDRRPARRPRQRRSTPRSSKAQAAGAPGAGARGRQGQKVQQIVDSYHTEPNKNYISSLDRLTELLENRPLLDHRAVAQLRRRCGRASSRPPASPSSRSTSRPRRPTDSKADLEAEHKKHEEERQTLADQGRPAPDRQRQAGDRDRQPRAPSSGSRRKSPTRKIETARRRSSASSATSSSRTRRSSTSPTATSPTSIYDRGEVQVEHQPPPGRPAPDEDDHLRRRLAGHPHREAQGDHRADPGRRPVQHRPDRQDQQPDRPDPRSATSSTRPPGRPTSRCGSP